MPHLCFPVETSTNLWPPSDWQYEGKRANHLLSVLFGCFSILRFVCLSPSPPLPPLPAERHLILNFPRISCRTRCLTAPVSTAWEAPVPPVSSAPPLFPLHLVLCVKLPIPVSHLPIPSRCCDLHLWCCSRQCSAHDVTTRFGHPVCLVSVSHSPSSLMLDAVAVIDVTSCWGLCQSDIQYRESQQKTGFLRFLSPDEKHICIVRGACCHLVIVCRYNTVFYSWAGLHGSSFYRSVWKIGYIGSVVFNH